MSGTRPGHAAGPSISTATTTMGSPARQSGRNSPSVAAQPAFARRPSLRRCGGLGASSGTAATPAHRPAAAPAGTRRAPAARRSPTYGRSMPLPMIIAGMLIGGAIMPSTLPMATNAAVRSRRQAEPAEHGRRHRPRREHRRGRRPRHHPGEHHDEHHDRQAAPTACGRTAAARRPRDGRQARPRRPAARMNIMAVAMTRMRVEVGRRSLDQVTERQPARRWPRHPPTPPRRARRRSAIARGRAARRTPPASARA